MYYYSYGVEQDYIQVVYWFTESTEQGDATAQYNLGYMYHYGDSIEQDYKKALELLTQSADKGNADAQALY